MRLLGNSNHKRTTNHRIVREHEFGPDAPYALPSLASSPSSWIANVSGIEVPSCRLLPPKPVETVNIFPATQKVP